MPTHQALLQDGPKQPLRVEDVETYVPTEGQVLMEVKAVACNPGEQKIHDYGTAVSTWPFIGGYDLAGIVHTVGPNVTNFKKGDRILTFNIPTVKSYGSAFGGYQKYALALSDLSAKIPDKVAFEQASTLPVTCLTSLAAFDHVGIEWPDAPLSAPSDEPILIWGGSSGTGQAAIQLARLSNYTNIIVTASARRHEYLRSLGALHTFDYRDPDIISKITGVLAGRPLVKIIDTVAQTQSFFQLFKLARPGAKIALVLPASTFIWPEGVDASFVLCSKWHDYLGKHPGTKKIGKERLWPMIGQIIASEKWVWQSFDVHEGDWKESVLKGWEVIRSNTADGKKQVVLLGNHRVARHGNTLTVALEA